MTIRMAWCSLCKNRTDRDGDTMYKCAAYPNGGMSKELLFSKDPPEECGNCVGFELIDDDEEDESA